MSCERIGKNSAEACKITLACSTVTEEKQNIAKLAKQIPPVTTKLVTVLIINAGEKLSNNMIPSEIIETTFFLKEKTAICQTVWKIFFGFSMKLAEFFDREKAWELHKKEKCVKWGFLFEMHTKHKLPPEQRGSLTAQNEDYFAVFTTSV